jgi:LPXTG-site transpeptidase (sortase) family protein
MVDVPTQPKLVTADWSVRRHRARPRGLGATRAAAVGLGVVGLGAATLTTTGALGIHPIPQQASAAWDLPAQVVTAVPKAPAPAKMPPGGPTNIRIPAISLTTSLEPIALDGNGSLAPPAYTDAGWYVDGTNPGDTGPAVIAGHYDTAAPGQPSVFYRLDQLKTGDTVQVERGGQWLTFTVDSVQSFPQLDFPSALVYGPTPDAELRLITCGGSYDAGIGAYVDNVVVFATEQAGQQK